MIKFSKKFDNQIVAYSDPENKSPVSGRQLELFPQLQKSQKAQISSIPGVNPKNPNRYQVVSGDVILGSGLTCEQATTLAKRGGKR